MASIAIVHELDYFNPWLLIEIQPGELYTSPPDSNTFFGESQDPENPNVAILCCPTCEAIGAIVTLHQLVGLELIECKTYGCSSVYRYHDGILEPQKLN